MLKTLLRALRGRGGAAPLNEAGIAAWRRGELAAAERHFREALAAEPRFAPAYGNLGMIRVEQGHPEEGLAILRRAVELDPLHAEVRLNLANLLAMGGGTDEAVAHYQEVLRRHPGHPLATLNMLKPLLDRCDWSASEAIVRDAVAAWHSGAAAALDAMSPFNSLLVAVPQALRRALAERYAAGIAASAGPPLQAGPPRSAGGRLRVGYASADFRDHATTHLLVGVLERHDRDRYDVHAYSFGYDDGSAERRRIEAAVEHFHDVRSAGHVELARRIAADGIDVLVDLKGYTGEGRPEVLALRPAPAQVSWLGYPGTMGAPFVDFLLADGVVIPPGAESGYSETVIRLPHSYQANDDRQAIADRAIARSELGLPPSGVVFCGFNGHYKIERALFTRWLGILAAVPGSVLWLLDGAGAAALRRAASAAGVDPARLVFAPGWPKAEHLARHRAADLFLDTYTCNAHTTASDALWAGLPVLTTPADAFAGRVASSLLRAIGLPELVAPDADAYERTAVALARDPAALGSLRSKLAAHRTSAPLFDTARFTRDLEAAFDEMRARRGAT